MTDDVTSVKDVLTQLKKEQTLLEDILVAQVLTLAKAIDASKPNSSSTDHYIGEAINLLNAQRSAILQRVRDSHPQVN